MPLVHMDGVVKLFIESRLKELRMKMPVEGLRIKFKPSEEEAQKAFDFGVEIGNALK